MYKRQFQQYPGYYFTGETRGYKNGTFDRTKVLKPFSQGGWGAIQLNGRVDYLDLDTNKLKSGFSNNFLTGAFTPSNSLSRGGKQLGTPTAVSSRTRRPRGWRSDDE